jgi:nucleotide-binding universal stress UspA family protein
LNSGNLETDTIGGIVYKRMMVAYDESPEAKRALTRAIELAKLMGAELRLVTVSEPLPAFVAYADVGFRDQSECLQRNGRISTTSCRRRPKLEPGKADWWPMA